MNERRIQRIQELIKHRVAEVVDQELADPRKGLITITRVKVDRELSTCEVFWSLLGDERARKLNEHMLDDAAAFVQREVAAVLSTRTVPRLRFRFDESVEGAQRVDALLAELRRERGDDDVNGEVDGEVDDPESREASPGDDAEP